MPRLAPFSPDVVWFRGSDAVSFLNDILSQEISDIASGEVRRSMLLTPEGKLDHLLWVVKADDGVGLMTDPGRGEALAGTLRRFKIRVDVDIAVEKEPVWVVMGPWEGIDISWRGISRSLVIGNRPDLDEMDDAEYEALRIGQGEPLHGADFDEATIPQETGLVPLTVDFEKGCFLGQELVGRIDARGGNVPRPLRILDLAGDAKAGDLITLDGDDVGRVTSAAGTIGLGVVMRKVAVGEQVTIGDTTATVRESPPKTQS